MNRQEAYNQMMATLLDGRGVLTAGEIHPGILVIHDVGNHDGSRLKTSGEVRHQGFGYFAAETENGSVDFCGGGALSRVTEEDGDHAFSWCRFTGNIADTGYDFDAAKVAVRELIANL